MKRPAALIAILLAALAAGCGSTRAADTAAVRPSATTAAGSQTVVVDCQFTPQTRPSSVILACADGNDVLASLHWVSWGPAAAFATGVEQINDCTPDCAAGTFISYPVLVNLWRAEPLRGHPGVSYFSRITRVYTAHDPPLYGCDGKQTCYPQTSTSDLLGWPLNAPGP